MIDELEHSNTKRSWSNPPGFGNPRMNSEHSRKYGMKTEKLFQTTLGNPPPSFGQTSSALRTALQSFHAAIPHARLLLPGEGKYPSDHPEDSSDNESTHHPAVIISSHHAAVPRFTGRETHHRHAPSQDHDARYEREDERRYGLFCTRGGHAAESAF